MPANTNTFINCPFDEDYKALHEALVFAVHDCGYVARSAQEFDDSSVIRIQKIYALIKNARYGIHDLSRTELDSLHGLPRFNMPLELGLFLGAKEFGGKAQKNKMCLVLLTGLNHSADGLHAVPG